MRLGFGYMYICNIYIYMTVDQLSVLPVQLNSRLQPAFVIMNNSHKKDIYVIYIHIYNERNPIITTLLVYSFFLQMMIRIYIQRHIYYHCKEASIALINSSSISSTRSSPSPMLPWPIPLLTLLVLMILSAATGID